MFGHENVDLLEFGPGVAGSRARLHLHDLSSRLGSCVRSDCDVSVAKSS